MRNINKEMTINKPMSVTATIEEFVIINEDKLQQSIGATIQYSNTYGIISRETIAITGDKYSLLMSENPSFASGKPANEYREEDLWYIIDLIRNGQ